MHEQRLAGRVFVTLVLVGLVWVVATGSTGRRGWHLYGRFLNFTK